LKEQSSYAYLISGCLILYFKNAAQHALAPNAAALRFAAQVKRRPLAGMWRNNQKR
jgi:hypothetical protein